MADSEDIADPLRAELDELRALLRGKARRLVGVIEALEDPETLADAWRSVRLVRQTDAMVVRSQTPRPSLPRHRPAVTGGRPGFEVIARLTAVSSFYSPAARGRWIRREVEGFSDEDGGGPLLT